MPPIENKINKILEENNNSIHKLEILFDKLIENPSLINSLNNIDMLNLELEEKEKQIKIKNTEIDSLKSLLDKNENNFKIKIQENEHKYREKLRSNELLCQKNENNFKIKIQENEHKYREKLQDIENKSKYYETRLKHEENKIEKIKKELNEEKKKFESLKIKFKKQSNQFNNEAYILNYYEKELKNHELTIEYLKKSDKISKKLFIPISYVYIIFKSKPQEIRTNIKLYKILKNTNYFNIGYYLKKYPDIKKSKWCKYFSPELHYICKGFDENRRINKKQYPNKNKKDLLNTLKKITN